MRATISALGATAVLVFIAGCACTASPDSAPDKVTISGTPTPLESDARGDEAASEGETTATAAPGKSADGKDLGPGGGTITIDVALTEPAPRTFTTTIEASTAECATIDSRFSLDLPDSSHIRQALRREAVKGPWLYFAASNYPQDPNLNSQELSLGAGGRSYSAGGSTLPGLTQTGTSITLNKVPMTVFSDDAGAGERGTATVSGTITCSGG